MKKDLLIILKVAIGQVLLTFIFFLISALGGWVFGIIIPKINPYNLLWFFTAIVPLFLIITTFYFLRPKTEILNYLMAILGCLIFWVIWFTAAMNFWMILYGK